MKNLYLAIIALFVLGAQCERLPQFNLEEPFSLKIGEQRVADQDKNMVIQFSRIKQDSRCPKGVNCVWEGEVVAELILGKLGKDTLDLTFRPGREKAAVGRALGYHFRLQEVNPYPESSTPLKPEDYTIILEVKEE